MIYKTPQKKKTTNLETRIPLKTGCELRCSGRVLVVVPRVTPVYVLVINIGAHITANNNKLTDNYQGNPVEWAVPAPLVAPVLLFQLQNRWQVMNE
jgi:hypothetical protein